MLSCNYFCHRVCTLTQCNKNHTRAVQNSGQQVANHLFKDKYLFFTQSNARIAYKKKSQSCIGAKMFITTIPKPHHLTVSWVNSDHSRYPQPLQLGFCSIWFSCLWDKVLRYRIGEKCHLYFHNLSSLNYNSYRNPRGFAISFKNNINLTQKMNLGHENF